MTGLLGQITFVIWRESMEVLLVVGILHAWLVHHGDAKATAIGKRYLWGGVAAGLAAAGLLALIILSFASLPEGDREDYFQIAMAGFAALLIVQMVVWMHRQGSGLKQEFERGAERALTGGNWWGLFVLAAIAVMREGSETVVFLYGVLAAARETNLPASIAAVAGGFALAAVLYWLLQVASRRFPWSVFFRVTEALLLALAASLLMTALDRAIGLELVPPLSGSLWDTSWLLDDTGRLGAFIAAMTGYRARPELISVLVYIFYWFAAVALLRPGRRHAAERAS